MNEETETLLQAFLKSGIAYFKSNTVTESEYKIVDLRTEERVEPSVEAEFDKLREHANQAIRDQSEALTQDELDATREAMVQATTAGEAAEAIVDSLLSPPEPANDAPSPPKKSLRVFQDRLVKIIDDNEAALAKSIEQLGCGGDCYRCPVPEAETVDEQVHTCLRAAVEGLNLDKALLE